MQERGTYEEENSKYEIAKAKLELGYNLPLDVEEIYNQCVAVQLQMETAGEKRQLYMELIQLSGGEYQEPDVSGLPAELEKDFTEDFLQKVTDVKTLQLNYNSSLRQIREKENQIVIAEGRLEYERISFICDADATYYILTHTMEGQG